jgi:hypothetical protein
VKVTLPVGTFGELNGGLPTAQPPRLPATPERGQALDVKRSYQATIEALRANKDLTDEGRNSQIAAVHAATRDHLGQLRRTETARLQGEREGLQRDLFSGLKPGWNSTAADVVAIRDAGDRADALKNPADASTALARAHFTHDDSLASAIGQEAARRSDTDPSQAEAWQEVVGQFVANRGPTAARIHDRLAQIDDILQAPRLLDEFSISTPKEVRGDVGWMTEPSR